MTVQLQPTETPGGRERRPARMALRVAAALVAAAFIALLVYGVVTNSPDTSIDDALARQETPAAPAFDLAMLERGAPGARLGARLDAATRDGRLSSAELRGTPFVLNFWASWCTPCKDEAPVLERGWRSARAQGVLFLGVDMQDVSDDARAFLRQTGTTYPTIRDNGNETARQYGTTGIPETFFVDARGRIVGHVIGVVRADQLAEGIAAARTGRVAGAEEGGAQGAQRE